MTRPLTLHYNEAAELVAHYSAGGSDDLSD